MHYCYSAHPPVALSFLLLSFLHLENDGRQRTDELPSFLRVLASPDFKGYSFQTLSSALTFTQDLKLSHYIKVPPPASFMFSSSLPSSLYLCKSA